MRLVLPEPGMSPSPLPSQPPDNYVLATASTSNSLHDLTPSFSLDAASGKISELTADNMKFLAFSMRSAASSGLPEILRISEFKPLREGSTSSRVYSQIPELNHQNGNSEYWVDVEILSTGSVTSLDETTCHCFWTSGLERSFTFCSGPAGRRTSNGEQLCSNAVLDSQ